MAETGSVGPGPSLSGLRPCPLLLSRLMSSPVPMSLEDLPYLVLPIVACPCNSIALFPTPPRTVLDVTPQRASIGYCRLVTLPTS